MTVFKLYLKILKKNMGTAIIYFSVFFIIALSVITSQNSSSKISFENSKVNISFVDKDNTTLTKSLKDFLGDYANFKDIKEDKIDDAMFFNDIVMYIEIPEGFTDKLLNNQEPRILYKTTPQAISSFALTNAIDRFVGLSHIYVKNNIESESLEKEVIEILSTEIKVNMTQNNKDELASLTFYYNYGAYIILALGITLMGVIMIAFKPLEIKRRNNLASISNTKVNLMLLLGNLLVGMLILILLIILSVVLYKDLVLTTQGYLMMFNAFIFSISIIALAYLIVTLFDSPNVISALGTICSLGFSFITGVFVPQEFMNQSVLVLARAIPSFYYVANNNMAAEITNYSFANMKEFYINILIQIVFAAVFITISLIVSKKRQTAEN